ncbi:MAG: hypothetical protein CBD14_08385 [Proteobacteria bacterium TMED154]|nr:MAG: hypothetical protein CBD14_08385 [Proteobacteria bacterium TMED154]
MADIVSTQVLSDTSGVKYVAKLTNISDGSGESLVKKIDASSATFMTEDGSRKIAKIWWSVNTTKSNASVELVWGGETNTTAMLLNGQGYWDLRTAGNEIVNNATTPTGDVLLSTRDFVVGDNYTILVEFR